MDRNQVKVGSYLGGSSKRKWWLNCYWCAQYICFKDYCRKCWKYHCADCPCYPRSGDESEDDYATYDRYITYPSIDSIQF